MFAGWLWAVLAVIVAGVVFVIVPGLAVLAMIVGIVALIWALVLVIGTWSFGGRGRSDTELEHDEYLERNPQDAKYMRYDAKS